MKAFKPLTSNHQWIKKIFLTCSIMNNIILLHIDYSLYLYMFILNICCSALSAGKGGGCQCNVSTTYYSKIYGLIMNLK